MAEEEETIQDNEDVNLDSHQEEEEDVQAELQEPDKDKQKLDSALGRISGIQSKVDSQDAKFSSLDNKLDTILQTMTTPNIESTAEPDYTQDPDFMPTTKVELDAWYDKRRTGEIKADRDYSNAYNTQLDSLKRLRLASPRNNDRVGPPGELGRARVLGWPGQTGKQ